MANTFSINQVRQFYVCNDVMKASAAAVKAGAIKDFSVVADSTVAGTGSARVFYKNSLGEVVGSDMIDKKYIKSAKASVPKYKTIGYEITPINNIAIGKEYIVRVTVFGYGSPSRESQYYKFGTATAKTTVLADLIADLKTSLEDNFSKDPVPMFTVESTATTLTIKEVEQPWILGRKSAEGIDFTVQLSPVVMPADSSYIWGTVDKKTYDIAVNGKHIADLEYFCLGSRGDIYRNVGYPYVIKTDYQIDPSVNYAIIDIAHSYRGEGMNNQDSDKVVTLAIPYDLIKVNAVIAAINAQLGTNIAELV